MYRNLFKRILDFFLSLMAIVLLFPILVFLTITGAFLMGGREKTARYLSWSNLGV